MSVASAVVHALFDQAARREARDDCAATLHYIDRLRRVGQSDDVAALSTRAETKARIEREAREHVQAIIARLDAETAGSPPPSKATALALGADKP